MVYQLYYGCHFFIFNESNIAMEKNIYQFEVKTLKNETISLSEYKDKVILIVNTASECGFTPQYSALEEVYQQYKDQGFVVLGFPSNDFGGQEPLNGDEIVSFCSINYGVSFPMFAKSVVKGSEASPLFKFLSSKKLNGNVNIAPKWNFQKYLINKNGEVVDYFLSTTSPSSNKLKRAIEKLL